MLNSAALRILSLFAAMLIVPFAIGEDQSKRIEDLVAVMKASYDTSSWRAVAELASIGGPAIPALDKVIRERNHSPIRNVPEAARYQAIFALNKMGSAAELEVDLLISLVENTAEDSGIRWASAAALGSIGKQREKVVPALTRVLEEPKTPKSSLCGYVLETLKKFGPHVGHTKELVEKYESQRLCLCDNCGNI